MSKLKILNFISTLIYLLVSVFYINYYSEIYFYKNKIKSLQDKILEIEEENKIFENEILFLKNLEIVEEEMVKDGFKQIEKEDNYILEM